MLIAEDHALVREGLRAMLAGEPDLEVIGEAESGKEAVELCRSLTPDLVLMDVRMPEMDGLEATKTIKGSQPGVIVLMVSTHQDPDQLERLFGWSALGQRSKWRERPDYRRGTIEEALRGITQTYTPDGRREKGGARYDVTTLRRFSDSAAGRPSENAPQFPTEALTPPWRAW